MTDYDTADDSDEKAAAEKATQNEAPTVTPSVTITAAPESSSKDSEQPSTSLVRNPFSGGLSFENAQFNDWITIGFDTKSVQFPSLPACNCDVYPDHASVLKALRSCQTHDSVYLRCPTSQSSHTSVLALTALGTFMFATFMAIAGQHRL